MRKIVTVERGQAGERCALNLAGEGIAKDLIHRGDVVLDPALHAPTDRIDARLRLLPSERKPITQWTPVRLHHAAAEVGARVVLLGDVPIAPGEQGYVQLVLERPIAATAGDRFVLRDTSAQRTIGGGVLLDLRAPTRKRRTPERMAQLAAHAIREPERALAALLECAPAFVDLTMFARDRAFGADEVEQLAEKRGLMRIPVQRAVIALLPDRWLQLKNGMLDRLAAFHRDNPDLPGIGLERLRLQLEPRLPALAFAAALQSLARLREVALDGAWVRLPSHYVRLTPAEEKLWRGIQPLIDGKERFRPPRVRDVGAIVGVAETEVRRVFKLLGRLGKVDEVAHDHFFLRETVAEMVEIASVLATKAPSGQFTAAEFRDQLDNGRKVAIQILEFFDRHGVTIRRGDLRRMNKHRLDLFRRPADEPRRRQAQEGKRPRWGVRTSNPGEAASRSLVGSTPTLFRHVPGAPDETVRPLSRYARACGKPKRPGRKRHSPRMGRAHQDARARTRVRASPLQFHARHCRSRRHGGKRGDCRGLRNGGHAGQTWVVGRERCSNGSTFALRAGRATDFCRSSAGR